MHSFSGKIANRRARGVLEDYLRKKACVTSLYLKLDSYRRSGKRASEI